MKKSLIVLLINLFLTICCFSQNTYPKITQDSLILITPTQLKQTNLIFLEHSKLKLELDSYINKVNIQSKQIDYYINTIDLKDESYNIQKEVYTINENNLKKELRKSNFKSKCFMWGGITVSTSLLVLLLIK